MFFQTTKILHLSVHLPFYRLPLHYFHFEFLSIFPYLTSTPTYLPLSYSSQLRSIRIRSLISETSTVFIHPCPKPLGSSSLFSAWTFTNRVMKICRVALTKSERPTLLYWALVEDMASICRSSYASNAVTLYLAWWQFSSPQMAVQQAPLYTPYSKIRSPERSEGRVIPNDPLQTSMEHCSWLFAYDGRVFMGW